MADNNNLRGKIPSFSSSTKAYFIDLSGNQFTGEIPGELLGLPELEFLYLDDNRLSGQIPFNFGNSTSLIDLYLQDNQLTGNIPAFNGFLPKISKYIIVKPFFHWHIYVNQSNIFYYFISNS